MKHISVLSVLVSVLMFSQVLVRTVRGEYFSAIVHMEHLLDLEKELLGILNDYITVEEERYINTYYV